ncbi:carboxypeptidase regulatory-like domain-containing protein [Streptomyces sp. NBC_00102]|uniref:carboxypeptidase regulatory-like domain-containing protein n=1 Tax=Streptomyces sp. NBC_00102 TaxID=2975652 RepID=UPI00224F3208|nr:carboxypeptidase regulatory-like domain-containing protein [Streptomyces sp. NBC_00102]MCX5396819.1 carboxypeptidase regulatory-like domain-containing protein [Streptomyces sp. NBC_00102]
MHPAPQAGPPATSPTHAAPHPRLVRTLAETLWFPLALFLGFLFCFAPALHSPQPHHTRIAVAGPVSGPDSGTGIRSALDHEYPGGFEVSTVGGAVQARHAVTHREAAAALVTGDDPVLYVTKAEGAVLAQKMTSVFTALAAEQGHTLAVQEVVPLHQADPMGTSAVYVGIAWSVPGYILATALLRAVSFNRRKKFLFILGVAVLFSAIGSAVGAAAGFLPASPSSMVIAFLLTTAVATVASGLAPFTRQFFPLVGMGLFIVLSIPTSGGAAPATLLPTFFQYVHAVMPLANGVDALRGVLYFGGAGTLRPVLVLCAWIAAGLGLMGLDALRHRRRDARPAARNVEPAPPAVELTEDAEPVEPPTEDPALSYPLPVALPVHRHHFGDREPDLIGTVHGVGRGPVHHASVTVIDGHGRQLVRTTTDALGRYALAGLPEGHLNIIASSPGQTPAVQRKHLRPGTVVRSDFALRGNGPKERERSGAANPAE